MMNFKGELVNYGDIIVTSSNGVDIGDKDHIFYPHALRSPDFFGAPNKMDNYEKIVQRVKDYLRGLGFLAGLEEPLKPRWNINQLKAQLINNIIGPSRLYWVDHHRANCGERPMRVTVVRQRRGNMRAVCDREKYIYLISTRQIEIIDQFDIDIWGVFKNNNNVV